MEFEKAASKVSRSRVCKGCNGIASAYKRLGSVSPKKEFYKEYRSRINNPSVLQRENGWMFVCSYCEASFPIRKDAIFAKKTTSCSSCESYHSKYLNLPSKSVSTREFYLNQRSLIPWGNISIERTVESFQTNPQSLGPHSKSSIFALCSYCNKEFKSSMHSVCNQQGHISCDECKDIKHRHRASPDINPREYYLNKHHSIVIPTDLRDSTMEKYGYDPSSSPASSKLFLNTNCHYCGKPSPSQIRSWVKSNGNISCQDCRQLRSIQTLTERYGVQSVNSIPHVIEKMKNPYIHDIISRMLKDRYNVEFIREFPIHNLSFDFFVPSANLLIECQGDYFHDFKSTGYSGTPRDRGKATYIDRHTNYKLIHVWEHEIHLGRLAKILDYHIYGVTEPVVVVDDLSVLSFDFVASDIASEFLSRYHYLGPFTQSTKFCGAYAGSELVCLAAFGGITRDQSTQKISKHLNIPLLSSQIRELRRFVIRPRVESSNLASYCLSRFVKLLKQHTTNLKGVLSFSDPTVGDVGTIYKASNWKSLPQTAASYHYLDSRTNKIIHKKTVWDWARKIKMTEAGFSRNSGLLRVQELPKAAWFLPV